MVPLGREHGRYTRFAFRCCPEAHRLHFQSGMLQQIIDLLLVTVEHELQGARNIAHVKAAVAISQNALGSVVTSDNDKAR